VGQLVVDGCWMVPISRRPRGWALLPYGEPQFTGAGRQLSRYGEPNGGKCSHDPLVWKKAVRQA
jgi:hypothetical protein